ncbi:MAG: hypothetical protein AABZ10_03560 [Nitrospirota bacterium]
MNKRLNKEWHAKNRMPKNATLDERVQYHLEHSKKCGCRPVPESVLAYVRSKGRRSL